MNHPHGPSGPGEPGPGRPPHQRSPAYRPGFAPYNFPQPAPRPMPSGVTGIAAGVLAGLGALACLASGLLGVLGLTGLADPGPTAQTSVGIAGGLLPVLVLGLVLNIVAGVLLAGGSVRMVRRKMSGRRLVVTGCAVTIGASLLSLGYVAAATPRYGPIGPAGVALVSMIFPAATLIMVCLPSTTVWLRARRIAPNPPVPPTPY